MSVYQNYVRNICFPMQRKTIFLHILLGYLNCKVNNKQKLLFVMTLSLVHSLNVMPLNWNLV